MDHPEQFLTVLDISSSRDLYFLTMVGGVNRHKVTHLATTAENQILIIQREDLSFGIGLGAGLIRASESNLLAVSGKNIILEHQIWIIPKITAVPIRLGLFFTLPIHRVFSIFFNGGISLYLAKYSYDLATIWDDMNNIVQKANAKDFGFHGGIGLEINLNQRVSFLIEGQGRHDKISNFKGEVTEREYVFPNYVYSTKKGTLYFNRDSLHSQSSRAFQVGSLQIYPSVNNTFFQKDSLFLFFQVYGLSQELKNEGMLEYKF